MLLNLTVMFTSTRVKGHSQEQLGGREGGLTSHHPVLGGGVQILCQARLKGATVPSDLGLKLTLHQSWFSGTVKIHVTLPPVTAEL